MSVPGDGPSPLLSGFLDAVAGVAYVIEAAGVALIVAGLARATWRGLRGRHRSAGAVGDEAFRRFRFEVGRALLVGLEFLVAGDVIRTVVVAHSLTDIAGLGLLVLIRTILVFTIELEVEGRWPWQASTRPALSAPPTPADPGDRPVS